MCFPQTSYRKRPMILYLDKYKNHLNLSRSMMMKNGKLNKSWILAYTRKSFSTGSNGLDLMKTEHGILPQTSWDHLTDYTPSTWIILNALDRQRDSKNGYDHGKMEMKRWIAILMMNTPKTESSLGLRRGVMSRRCRWPLVVCTDCTITCFECFSFAQIKRRRHKKATLPVFSASSLSSPCLIFLLIAT